MRNRNTCKIEGCSQPKQFDKHCIPHAKQFKIAPFDIPCRLDFCENFRSSYKTGLCFTHDKHLRAGKELKPLRGRSALYGPITESSGYVLVWNPTHPNARKNGRVLEHIAVMTEHIGRALEEHENVHHKNGNRQDNRLENLELWSTKQPYGQRVQDKLKYALEIIDLYYDDFKEEL